MKAYTTPSIAPLGTVRELTLGLNKVGTSSDIYSKVVPLIGSIVPSP